MDAALGNLREVECRLLLAFGHSAVPQIDVPGCIQANAN
jgi:hypothetical protein